MGKPILLYTAIDSFSVEQITEQILSSDEGEDIDIWIDFTIDECEKDSQKRGNKQWNIQV